MYAVEAVTPGSTTGIRDIAAWGTQDQQVRLLYLLGAVKRFSCFGIWLGGVWEFLLHHLAVSKMQPELMDGYMATQLKVLRYILGGWILWKRYRSLLFKQEGPRALHFKLSA